jgi:DNA polymerase III subunit alpha
MLDGASRVDDLMRHVASDNQPAVAITDHGVLFGLVEFYRRAKDNGVKPILGSEVYQAVGSRRDQQTGGADGRQRYYHLTTLAMNDTGYQNLIALSTRAYLEGYWYKPRIDHELLAEHSDGLIVLSGCLGSELNQHLIAGNRDAARKVMSDFKDHGIPEQRRIWPELESLAKELGLKTVITNDSHYTKATDAEAHDALLCIQTGAKINEPNRFRFDGDQYYVKSAAEMRETFHNAPDALDTTLLIAEMCDVTIATFSHPRWARPAHLPAQRSSSGRRQTVRQSAAKQRRRTHGV